MTKRIQYSHQTVIEALAELDRNKGNLNQTSKKIGVPPATIGRWAKEREYHQRLQGRTDISPLPKSPDADIPLADSLQQIVNRMVAIMPEKVEEASLQELTRSLTTILATMNQVRVEVESKEDIELYERLVRHMAQLAHDGSKGSGVQPDAPAQAD